MSAPDIEQVLDLMHNGFSREGAAMAVAESHGEGEEYVHALLAHPSVANMPDAFEVEAYVAYCDECEAENLEPHTFHMWQVHGRPEGPLS